MLGELVTEVSAFGFPINEKLVLLGAVLDPIEAHVDSYRYFLFDRSVGEAFSGGIVDADWSRWLRIPEFCEDSEDWHILLNIMGGGAVFGFSGRRHHVVENIGDGVYRAVKRGVGYWWLGRASGLVANEVVATCTLLPEDRKSVGL